MKEAEDGCTTWENVSEDTFVRFGQYIYTGDYQGAAPFTRPVTEGPSTEASNGDAVAESLVDPFVNTPKKTTKKKTKSSSIAGAEPTSCHTNALLNTKTTWAEYKSLRFYECSGGSYSLPTDNDHYSIEYQEVFLSHARVHTLAACYMVEPLAQLSLDKLPTILCHSKLVSRFYASPITEPYTNHYLTYSRRLQHPTPSQGRHGSSPICQTKKERPDTITSEQGRRNGAAAIAAAKSRIHISCDLLTSPNCLAILGIVSHYVTEDGQLEHHTLALKDIDSEHGSHLAAAVLDVVEGWGFAFKLGYFMMNNASNNDTMMASLSLDLLRRFDIQYDPRVHRLRCQGHTINLAARAFLFVSDKETLEREASGNITSLKDIQAWRERGPLGKLHNFVAIDGYFSKWKEAECAGDELSADDWAVLEKIKNVLEKLEMTTKALESSFVTLDHENWRRDWIDPAKELVEGLWSEYRPVESPLVVHPGGIASDKRVFGLEEQTSSPRMSTSATAGGAMATDLLSIPAMSAEPERLFSGAKLTVPDRRNRLGSEDKTKSNKTLRAHAARRRFIAVTATAISIVPRPWISTFGAESIGIQLPPPA
ncbi:hypothetical protein PWT90_04256 [Aphanocladium album]|nr:hypothetical protein PWT90_04256 [Aphanocladium album]